MAIQISGTTVIDNSRNVTNTVNVSASSSVTAASFYGDGSGLTGITASGVGTAIDYDGGDRSPFSYINASVNVVENIVLDIENAGTSDTYIVVQEPTLIINAGIAVTVGTGKTLVQDLYQLGDL